MITCAKGQGESFVCDKGSMVLHADTVDYDEKTGEIQASGNVRVVPYQATADTVK
jgi:lipopolysaccharide assembly outer membrane protein LptD (OstA)